MLVCGSCRHLGKPYVEEANFSPRPNVIGGPRFVRIASRRASELPKEMTELEVAEDYSKLVRRKRMKVGLSQEELAKRVKVKLSFIQKIETGKMAPDSRLCRELEHELKIKLLVPRKEATIPKSAAPAEITLGDIIHIKDRTKPSEET